MNRDRNLDGVKGIACIFMILAHAYGFGKTTDNWATMFMYLIGLYAPVLFLSSIGISLTYQVKIKHNLSIIAGYVVLFIVSFANMGLRLSYKDYFTLEDGNLYASIALSALLTLFILDYVHLFIIIIPIILLYFLNKSIIGVSLLYGGVFSVIPWVLFTLVGLYLHFHKHLVKVACFAMLVLSLYQFNINRLSSFDEYNTPFYFTVGLFIYSFSLIVIPSLLKIKLISQVLLYLGQNSLLFYVVHRLIVIYFPFKLFAPIVWIFLFTSTISVMYLFIKINNLFVKKYSHIYYFWAFLLLMIFIPSLISMNIHLQRAIMLSVLVLHALNYHNFTNLGIFAKISLKKNKPYVSR